MKQTSNYQLPQWETTDRVLMDDFNGMTEKIDTAIAAIPYTFLRKAALEEPAAQLDLDVSDLTLTDYCKLELFIRIPSGTHGWSLRVNNRTDYKSRSVGSNAGGGTSSDSENSSTVLAGAGGTAAGRPSYLVLLHQPNPGGKVACTSFDTYFFPDAWYFGGSTNISMTLTWDQVETFNLLPALGTLPAGTTLVLCGVKLF